jgi:nickel-dependent lactate racemase
VAHIDSITHYHLEVPKEAPESRPGRFDRNVMRFDIEEPPHGGAGLQDRRVVNERGETTGVFAGDFLEAHRQAVAEAKILYALDPVPRNKQIMIANAFAKPNEMPIAVLVGAIGLEGFRGTVVVIANAPEGQVTHYLLGRFGQDYGGRQYPVSPIPGSVRLIIQSPYGDKAVADWFSNPTSSYTKDWQETLRLLRPEHGAGTRVGVVPSATMAYYAG